ncbi:iron transporter [Candidatus Wolfebacteria bacterium RIFOXYB1_FULL_54_12]|uniref:Iron transporter n=1 Tax=Candidatus Wolfebacteria bacterium RIFOXYB1_FULL_54_12 TaxID=1802559 RepID=A0A1F8DZ80_9BACT|nr:MAG: iron transporter [Candidatus Wolfebacteria bacterium RIFOXYB1_FULL_54_12]
MKRFSRFLRILGPGIVTGAADDDPSGIATYSQAGAQFGFQMPWTMLITYPLMTAVQEACMRIGAITGKGLAAAVREHYPKKILYPVVGLVVLANTLNIGSDIGAMAASAELLVPALPFPLLAIAFALLIILLEVFISYHTYIRILKWLSMALFAYFITAFLIDVPWLTALKATLMPRVEWSAAYLYIIVAIFGTTISPYLFFWQTSNVVEEEIASHRLPQHGGIPHLTRSYLKRLRIDTAIGMLFSNVTAWFIIIVGAVVLNQAGITTIETAADAARALEPLVHTFPNAGFLAKLIFAIGIIGIGLQSIPVLAGSSAYAVAETFSWREGLYRKFRQSHNFYFVIIFGTLAGLLFNFIGFNPIKALVFTAVFNGIAAVPLIFLIARISSREDVMGEYKSGWVSKLGLWTAFTIMSAFAIALLVSFI